MSVINVNNNTLKIGLVSISDRASTGVYEDKGLPALQEWFGLALSSPWAMEARLIPDEQPLIEATLKELVDVCGRQGDARLWRTNAPNQPALRPHRHPLAPSWGNPQTSPDFKPPRTTKID